MTCPSLRLAHLSDLHFAEVAYSPFQFFSKRWLGNLNLLFSRRNQYPTERLFPLVDFLKEQKVSHVIISGDLSTTSRRKEFSRAAAFVEKLQKAGIETIALPGNHDQYTKDAFRKQLFYDFFPTQFSQLSPFNLKEQKVAVKSVGHGYSLIALDTALATSLVSSRGYFSPEIEEHLQQLLSSIPQSERLIIANHFPLFDNDSPRKILIRSEALRNTLKAFAQVKMYLHGHSHRHCIADLRDNGYPIVLDSGSTTHRVLGSWNLITLSSAGCEVEVFRWDKKNSWQSSQTASFTW